MLLRPGTPDDAPAIESIRVAGWRAAYRGIVPVEVLDAMNTQPSEHLIRRLSGQDDRQTILVAANDSGVIGFANFGPYRVRRSQSSHDSIGELYAIYVDPRYWGQGAGSALLGSVVQRLTAANLSPVRLWVLRDNHPARRFYERHGFAPDGATQLYRPAPDTPLPELRYARRS